jgi:tRNA pseudouridine13 synthase
MRFDPLQPPPLLTANLPGIGGVIRQQPEDFEVEEIPAYEPSGQGEFLYLWIEKRDMGAEYFMRQVARRLNIRPGEVGAAGLKDRRAVTRQWISVPASVADNVNAVDGDGIRLLRTARHSNKLRPGHLRGNRFSILIRNVDPEAAARVGPLVEHLRAQGMPNFYGEQRFGKEGETARLGFELLRGDDVSRRVRNPFLRKLALSAAQSALFNHYLATRLNDQLFRRVLPGDVMAKWPVGGLFVATDPVVEQDRFDRRETVHTGPIFGRKTFAAAQDAAEREAACLADAGLSLSSFRGFGKLMQGTRRHNIAYMDDLQLQMVPEGARLTVTLPAGSYATVLLGEIIKGSQLPEDQESAEMAE